jgi:hypothetical protein
MRHAQTVTAAVPVGWDFQLHVGFGYEKKLAETL